MPVYPIQGPNGTIVARLEGDSPPTEQELDRYFSSFKGTPQGVVPPEVEKQIREEASSGVGSKLLNAFKIPFEAGADVVRNLGGASGELYQTIEQAAQTPSLEEKLKILLRIPRAGVETGGKLGFDALNLLKQGGGAIINNPMLLTPKGQGEAIVNYFTPKQLTDQQVEEAFQKQLEAKAFGQVRGGGEAGEGKVPEAGMGTLPEFLTNIIGQDQLPALSEAGSQMATLETPLTALGALGLTKIPSATRRMAGRPHSMLGGALKLSDADIDKRARFNSGMYTRLLPEIKTNYRGPIKSALTNTGATDAFLEAGSKALKERGEVFAPTIKEADAAKYFGDKNAILSQWDQRLAESVSTPEIRARLLADKDLVANLNSLTPENLLQRAHELNNDLVNFYKKPNPQMSPDAVLSKEALRDTYSGLVKTILDDAGIDPRVYSEYGAIREMTDQIGKNNSLNIYKQEVLKGDGSAKKFIASTSAQKLFGGVEALIAPFTGGEVAALNKKVNTFMRDTPAVKPNFKRPPALSRVIQDAIDQGLPEAQARALQEQVNAVSFAPSSSQIAETLGLEQQALQERLQELLRQQQPYP